METNSYKRSSFSLFVSSKNVKKGYSRKKSFREKVIRAS